MRASAASRSAGASPCPWSTPTSRFCCDLRLARLRRGAGSRRRAAPRSPQSAETWAMPWPMVPAPTIPTCVMVRLIGFEGLKLSYGARAMTFALLLALALAADDGGQAAPPAPTCSAPPASPAPTAAPRSTPHGRRRGLDRRRRVGLARARRCWPPTAWWSGTWAPSSPSPRCAFRPTTTIATSSAAASTARAGTPSGWPSRSSCPACRRAPRRSSTRRRATCASTAEGGDSMYSVAELELFDSHGGAAGRAAGAHRPASASPACARAAVRLGVAGGAGRDGGDRRRTSPG